MLNAFVSCVLRQNARAILTATGSVFTNVFSHCVTLIRVLLSQIIESYSDTQVLVLVVMECKRANVIYVYELIFILNTSRSTECRPRLLSLDITIAMCNLQAENTEILICRVNSEK